MAKEPTAYWPTPSLIRSLSRVGWGELSGREFQGVRSTLRALADLLPDKSGKGAATAYQISEASGLSERWTRRCLNVLEDMGIIKWDRGGVVDGRPAPSWFTIVKNALVVAIHKAREIATGRRLQHREKTASRLQTLKPRARVFNSRQSAGSRRSTHAELSASLRPPYGGGSKITPTGNKINLNRSEADRAAIRQATLMDELERANARRIAKDAVADIKEMLRAKGILWSK
ncbi:MAG: hypothetical protein MSQ68_00980 [Trueperella pyogenes]|nr:hypothetical protein [Trueperella pyogenes]MCI7688936.1 hypothetical protein [Trueperella pyogenes]